MSWPGLQEAWRLRRAKRGASLADAGERHQARAESTHRLATRPARMCLIHGALMARLDRRGRTGNLSNLGKADHGIQCAATSSRSSASVANEFAAGNSKAYARGTQRAIRHWIRVRRPPATPEIWLAHVYLFDARRRSNSRARLWKD
jgi:hypothetical protein